MKSIFLLILIINCSISFGQKDNYDKVSFVNESSKDTSYQVFYDNDTKDCISTSIIVTPPHSTTIIAYPKTKKVSIEQADTKQKVIDELKKKNLTGVDKIEQAMKEEKPVKEEKPK
jgi:hypothetical protein